MPETLAVEDRMPLMPAPAVRAIGALALTDRLSLGYTLAATVLQGALFGYLNSIQQIMVDVFHRPAAARAGVRRVGGHDGGREPAQFADRDARRHAADLARRDGRR